MEFSTPRWGFFGTLSQSARLNEDFLFRNVGLKFSAKIPLFLINQMEDNFTNSNYEECTLSLYKIIL